MFNDKFLNLFVILAVFALMLLVPGLPGVVTALVTGIPDFYSGMTIVLSGIAFGARWAYLRGKKLI